MPYLKGFLHKRVLAKCTAAHTFEVHQGAKSNLVLICMATSLGIHAGTSVALTSVAL
jgi:hypothetical protein